MSRQSLIENYFKSKASISLLSPTITTNEMKVKKRRLSLKKPLTPTKSPKVRQDDKNVTRLLHSDDEEVLDSTSTPKIQVIDITDSNEDEGAVSDSSVLTVPYSLSPGTPKKTASTVKTPDSTPRSFRMRLKFEEDELSLKSSEEFAVDIADVKSEEIDETSDSSKSSSQIIPSGTPINTENDGQSKKIDTDKESIKVEKIEEVQNFLNKSPQDTSHGSGCINVKSIKTEKNTPEHSQEIAKIPLKSSETVRTPQKTLPRPTLSQEKINVPFVKTEKVYMTPQKTPQKTPQSQSSSSPSPSSKFFSPVKKRSILKRSPVKRSLNMEMSNAPGVSIEDDLYNKACEGMDDKTIFLLTIINRYLNDASLKHLLDNGSHELLASCLQVLKPGMRLVCRLYWRKKEWYKLQQVKQITFEKVSCDDSKMQEILRSLVEKGLIEQGDRSNMNFDDYKTILSREELKQICKELKLKMNNKQDAIDALLTFSKRSSNMSHYVIGFKASNNSLRVLQIMSAKAGTCYRLSDLAQTTLYKLYVLMYMGMNFNIIREKRLELTLLYDKIGRETYPVNKEMVLDSASVVFRSRDDFERYMTAHYMYEDYLAQTDAAEKCNIVKKVYELYKDTNQDEMAHYQNLPLWLRRYTPANTYIKILEDGIQDLKKEKHCLLALEVLTSLITQSAFRQHKKADWYADKALILHGVERYDEAAEVLLEGFKCEDLSEDCKDKMRPRARKIASQKNIVVTDHLKKQLLEYATKDAILEKNLGGEHIHKQPMERTNKRGKVKFETRTEGGRTVQDAEEYCITHYICTGQYTHGEHWEGRIVTTIFYLLFWDIIYSKPTARGVYLSHYQVYPLDMFCGDSFYVNRKTVIDDWLTAVERFTEEKFLNVMHDTWSNRPEGELSGITRAIGWDKIAMVGRCLGARAAAAVCRRLATNYRYCHSGFPDLTLWNVNTKQIKFVEVKTDTDKPSMKQIQWMNYLRQHGIDTEFCYVGVNTTGQRCRKAKSETLDL